MQLSATNPVILCTKAFTVASQASYGNHKRVTQIINGNRIVVHLAACLVTCWWWWWRWHWSIQMGCLRGRENERERKKMADQDIDDKCVLIDSTVNGLSLRGIFYSANTESSGFEQRILEEADFTSAESHEEEMTNSHFRSRQTTDWRLRPINWLLSFSLCCTLLSRGREGRPNEAFTKSRQNGKKNL